jgi:hypothetical protein
VLSHTFNISLPNRQSRLCLLQFHQVPAYWAWLSRKVIKLE